MQIAHISDFHVFADVPETSLVRADAADAARKVVDDIASFSPKIDAVMLTGDLADGGSVKDYALLADILSPITVPVFVVPGNHDKREGMRTVFGNSLPFGSGPFLNYEAEISGVRILALDTLIEGQVEGRLDPSQLAWISGKLEKPTTALTMILMHHPAFPSGISALDRMSLREGREAFAHLVAAYRGPLRILSGHIHRPFQALWNGAFCAVSGSPAFQHDLNLEQSAPEPGPVSEPYAYFVHKLDDPETVTIHTRYLSL